MFEHEGIPQKELAAITDKDPAALAKILEGITKEEFAMFRSLLSRIEVQEVIHKTRLK
ncbi:MULTISPECIES: hypothetical protein [Paenibacillus]|uniref:hypothetical protein n=1 Tax=Paenibacillus TaxID=44249 RepID=UPI001C3EE32D|nr:hypothetical protein [Paenibacillus sp. 7523-1]